VGSSDTSPLAAKTFYTARNICKPSRYAYWHFENYDSIIFTGL